MSEKKTMSKANANNVKNRKQRGNVIILKEDYAIEKQNINNNVCKSSIQWQANKNIKQDKSKQKKYGSNPTTE